jgi:triosephosphate isomerase
VIAYEPVWAIGSGQSASPEETNQIIGGVIRSIISNLWGEDTAQKVRVLYGGSVSPENAGGFLNQSEVDGALIGGASLTPEKFIDIIEIAS